MIKFSICLDPVYKDYDLYDRVKIAADQGYDGIEFWDIEAFEANKMRRTCEDNHIRLANVNCVNVWENNMSQPWGIIEKNMEKTFKIADKLNTANILVLAGDVTGREHGQQAIITENMKRLSERAEKHGIQVSIEPLNSLVEHKGHFLNSSGMGFEIVKCVYSPRIRMVYDIYHMQIMEGNIIANMTKNEELIGHVHSAGCPGRHEHFLGENDYPNILRALEAAGYEGYVGSEYFPSYDSVQSTRDVLEYLRSYVKKG
jgi:hydroxypyruvate isomerase